MTENLLLHNLSPHFRHYLSDEKTVKVMMDQITDAELVAKVRHGDKEAFGQLVERYQLMVGHIAKKMIDDAVDPQTIAEAHDLNRLVLDTIDELSSRDKEATLLFYYEQFTLQEIAAVSGVSVGAIKGRLRRARKQLQERLSMVYVPERSEEQRKMNTRQVTIEAVREHPGTRQCFMVLKDDLNARLVIWIGRSEALTIAAGLTETSPPRPTTAHLMASLFEITGIQLKDVRIEACKDDIFYAVITIANGKGEHDLDARPSDALLWLC